jgi:hypothetical protein
MDDDAPGVKSLRLDWEDGRCTLTVRDRAGVHTVACGLGAWLEGTTTLDVAATRTLPRGAIERRVAGSAAWTAPDTLAIKLCFYETPFHPALTLRFDGDLCRCCFATNAGWEGAAALTWSGRSARARR